MDYCRPWEHYWCGYT